MVVCVTKYRVIAAHFSTNITRRSCTNHQTGFFSSTIDIFKGERVQVHYLQILAGYSETTKYSRESAPRVVIASGINARDLIGDIA